MSHPVRESCPKRGKRSLLRRRRRGRQSTSEVHVGPSVNCSHMVEGSEGGDMFTRRYGVLVCTQLTMWREQGRKARRRRGPAY